MTKNKAAAMLGAKGGSVKSEAKAAAARANGMKGGRPPLEYRCADCHRPASYGEKNCHPAAGIESVPTGATLAPRAAGLVPTWETADERA